MYLAHRTFSNIFMYYKLLMWLQRTADNIEWNCWKAQITNKKRIGEGSSYIVKNRNSGGMNNDTHVIHVLGLFFRSLQWLLLASYNTEVSCSFCRVLKKRMLRLIGGSSCVALYYTFRQSSQRWHLTLTQTVISVTLFLTYMSSRSLSRLLAMLACVIPHTERKTLRHFEVFVANRKKDSCFWVALPLTFSARHADRWLQ